MDFFCLFAAGLFSANGIPHFVFGIAGKEFHTPFFYRFFRKVPTPLFNVVWGLLNFCLALFLKSRQPGWAWGWNSLTVAWGAGFAFASVGLSILFHNRAKRQGQA